MLTSSYLWVKNWQNTSSNTCANKNTYIFWQVWPFLSTVTSFIPLKFAGMKLIYSIRTSINIYQLPNPNVESWDPFQIKKKKIHISLIIWRWSWPLRLIKGPLGESTSLWPDIIGSVSVESNTLVSFNHYTEGQQVVSALRDGLILIFKGCRQAGCLPVGSIRVFFCFLFFFFIGSNTRDIKKVSQNTVCSIQHKLYSIQL